MIEVVMQEEKLAHVGSVLGQALKGGEVIELIGDVGAGKTTLTRAIARGLGITEPIQSPTFTISNRYETSSGLILAHYDFYRLHDAGIMREELTETLEDRKAVVAVEWGDIVADVLPDERLTIELRAVSETERQLTLTPHGAYYAKLLEELT